MAFKTDKHDDMRKFSDRLMSEMRKSGFDTAPTLAAVLFEKGLVKVKQDDKRYQYDDERGTERRKNAIGSITHKINEHLKADDPSKVQGEMLCAYCDFFGCSSDYLLGRTSVRTPNADTRAICEKTGLTEEAVANLLSMEKVDLTEYLTVVQKYVDLDTLAEQKGVVDEYGYLAAECAVNTFWSRLLESSMYTEVPRNWFRMVCTRYTKKWLTVVAREAEIAGKEYPSWETFNSAVETYNIFHESHPVCIPFDKSLYDVYQTEQQWVMDTYHEIEYDTFYSAADKGEEVETAYWGCVGMFDRYLLNYFHENVEEWCSNGPLPPVPN